MQRSISVNLNSSIFFNISFLVFHEKILVLGVLFNNKSDSGILDFRTPPIF